MNEHSLTAIPCSSILPRKRTRFKPKWFGSSDYLAAKQLMSIPRLSPPMIDIAQTPDGRFWFSPRGFRR